MASVSWESLLAPLAAADADIAVNVLRQVPVPLAAAVLRQVALQARGQQLSEQAAQNVVWKHSYYLPAATCGPRSVAPLPASLKSLQETAMDIPVARIHAGLAICSTCSAEKLTAKSPVAHARIANNATTQTVQSNRFKVYSLAAGLLWADFLEEQCVACKRLHLGNWSYARGQSRFGHACDLRCDAMDSHGFFVVPKFRSYYAVEVALLHHITDSLQFCGGSMKAAVLVWARRHQEPWQSDLLLGRDHTLLPHTIDNLLLAWYAWRAVSMSQPHGSSHVWDLTPAGFDACLLAHIPRIREKHVDAIAEHIQACPRCKLNPCIIVDGKAGARRLICAGAAGAGKTFFRC